MIAQKRNSNVVSMTAPIKGWNVRDPLPLMDAGYAPILDNVFCLPSEVQVRKGWVEYATFDGVCNTLLEYNPLSGGKKIFACTDDAGACSIVEITGGGVGVSRVSGLTNSFFKQTHCATSGGDFSFYVNGADDALLYDGSTFYSVNSSSTPYAITGPSSTEFSDVILHKRRLWFVEKNSLSCWYLPTDQIAGAAVKFDFSPIFTRGGRIVKIDTWSLDAGAGLDDYFMVFTTEGEVAVYRGTDPASYTTWSLTGVFYIGSPTSSGFTCKYGGDLLILNKDGIAQMSKSLMSSRVSTNLQMTDKIQPQLAQDTSTYLSNNNWDLLLYPPENMLIVNIPIADGVSYQYTMNTISGAWSRWKSIPARCWRFFNESIFFGADGFVGHAWESQGDNGNDIVAEVLPAYQNFGAQSRLKRWSMARIVLATSGTVSFGSRMETDFNLNPAILDLPFLSSTQAATYDVSTYGSSYYGDALTIKAEWKNTTGMGYWGSLHMKFKTKHSDVRLYSIDLVSEAGGNI